MSRSERWAIASLAALAFVRVLCFSGAYPFFTNVDEHRHVDMVLKYAAGALPHPDRATYQPEIGALLATYGSPEYILAPGRPAAPPLWQVASEVQARRVSWNERHFRGAVNLENFQSPAYYALGGAWLKLGRGLGISGGHALYWVRSLNAFALAALVLCAGLLLQVTHNQEPFIRLGVPLLLASAPPDALYYVTGDGASMFAGGAAFAAIVRLAVFPQASLLAYAGTGLLMAFAFLVKAPNLVVVGLALLLPVASLRAGTLRQRAPSLFALTLGFGLPVGAWLVRCLSLTGSALGTSGKVAGLGWGVRPVLEWFGHPLFSPAGLWSFLRDLTPIFWRGEVVWHRTVLAIPAVDAFYSVSTAVFLGLALVGWRKSSGAARRAEALAFMMLAGSLAVLAVLSLRFVFGENTNPPASHPFFVQGRLIAGAWFAFALLYVRGIERATHVLPVSSRASAGWVTLGMVAALCVGSELWLVRPVFASVYNAFHLPFLP